jgi:hypothetical protein
VSDPLPRAIGNIVRAALAWQAIAFADRAASRRASVEQEECKARLFAAVESYKSARRAEKWDEEAPTKRKRT